MYHSTQCRPLSRILFPIGQQQARFRRLAAEVDFDEDRQRPPYLGQIGRQPPGDLRPVEGVEDVGVGRGQVGLAALQLSLIHI